MKSKTTLILFSSLTLMVGYLAPVQAVTDAELEALEKQIEQQEAEEKKKAALESKRKHEEEKQLAEQEKRRQEEDQKIE